MRVYACVWVLYMHVWKGWWWIHWWIDWVSDAAHRSDSYLFLGTQRTRRHGGRARRRGSGGRGSAAVNRGAWGAINSIDRSIDRVV